MSQRLKKALIAQTGGPTPVANETLVAVAREFRKNGISPFGVRGGWEGLAKSKFFDFTLLTDGDLDTIKQKPGFFLGTSKSLRVIDESAPSFSDGTISSGKLLATLEAFGADYLVVIGGNSSAGVLRMIEKAALSDGCSIRFGHAPKTIDNDLKATSPGSSVNLSSHTPGFGSAAKGVIEHTYGVDFDCRSTGMVFISVVMGRDAGWLAASSALARRDAKEGPHLIYLPEHAFDQTKFESDVAAVLSSNHYAHVIVSEGVWSLVDGVKKRLVDTAVDLFGRSNGHLESNLGGLNASACTPLLQVYLANLLKPLKAEVRTGALGYYIRTNPDRSVVDEREAKEVGEALVSNLLTSSCTTLLTRDRFGTVQYAPYPLDHISLTDISSVPAQFISADGTNVTDAFLRYVTPIVGEAHFGRLPRVRSVDSLIAWE